jgi:hypothetical protein
MMRYTKSSARDIHPEDPADIQIIQTKNKHHDSKQTASPHCG